MPVTAGPINAMLVLGRSGGVNSSLTTVVDGTPCVLSRLLAAVC